MTSRSRKAPFEGAETWIAPSQQAKIRCKTSGMYPAPMNKPSSPKAVESDERNDEGWLTRPRVSALALIAITALAFYLCWKMIEPFVPALAWAMSLAILGYRLHRWIGRRIRNSNLSAGLATAVLIVFIAVPIAATAPTVAGKLKDGWESLLSESVQSRVNKAIRSNPSLAPVASFVARHAPPSEEIAKQLGSAVSGFVTGSFWAGIQLLIAFLALFYLLRDRERVLRYLRSTSPLTTRETERLFARAAEVVRASIFGTLLVAAVQGLLGGLMFWWLGLPAPLLWGMVMFVLSVVPILGAAVVWIPAAVLLATEGSWEKALILTLWGSVVVGLIDNLLYPIFVGDKLRLHTLVVFIAIVGGLLVFGASGLVLGPLVLAVTVGVMDIWRERTSAGQAADAAPADP
jgi:predicted PurR-regulated permease PerM